MKATLYRCTCSCLTPDVVVVSNTALLLLVAVHDIIVSNPNTLAAPGRIVLVELTEPFLLVLLLPIIVREGPNGLAPLRPKGWSTVASTALGS
jgi:hypothetical protein